MMTTDHFKINLSLISHTNIGKTTLSRTLLGEDVGEVRDEAHVTQECEEHVLVRSATGGQLILWDNPGFENSERLAARFASKSNPIRSFLNEVWDRFTNQAFWLNQVAIKHMRDKSDVILYVIEAHDDPEKTYYDAEIQILEWVNKPVIVLLNQTHKPLQSDEEEALVNHWKERFAKYSIVKAVLPLDAFWRCWVQETTLFDTLRQILPESLLPTFDDLYDSWIRTRRAIYEKSISAMAHYLFQAFEAKELAPASSFRDHFEQLKSRIKFLKSKENNAIEDAQTALGARLTDNFCQLNNELIRINRLKGDGVSRIIIDRMKTNWNIENHSLNTPGAAAVGAGTGASVGLALDIALGGLSLGAATFLGGLIGGIGGAGIAEAYNSTLTKQGSEISLSNSALNLLILDTILLYLAISHYGRGRGEWKESAEYPEFWKETVKETLQKHPVDWNALRKAMPEQVQDAISANLFVNLRDIFQKMYNKTP